MNLGGVQDFRRELPVTQEFARIEALEQREWSEKDPRLLAYAVELTRLLKTPHGTMTLLPAQAQALYELSLYRGVFSAIETGGGKTLTSFLAPLMVGAKRPLLLTLGGLIEDKTRPELLEYSKHFKIPNWIYILGYELLGKVSGAHLIDQYQPDIIIADEAHKLKNLDAGVTARVARYLERNPWCVFVDLSGTWMDQSLGDFAHRLEWCLGRARSPIPTNAHDLDSWNEVIGEAKRKTRNGVVRAKQFKPGAMFRFARPNDFVELVEDPEVEGSFRPPTDYDVARRALGNRLRATPGVVVTQGESVVGASLQFRRVPLSPPASLVEAMNTMLQFSETPDGWSYETKALEWGFLRSLSLGFYRRRDPWPPKPWLKARRIYTCAIRSILRDTQRDLDTALQVVNEVHRGAYWDKRIETSRGERATVGEAFTEWERIRDTFEYRTVAEWLSDHALLAAEAWARNAPGIVWCEDVEFAEELARRSGLPYYAAKGRDAKTGKAIESEKGDRSIIASVEANSAGRNLQGAFNRNLVTNVHPNAKRFQQLASRTHRPHQRQPVVHVDFLIGSEASEEAIRKIVRGAQVIHQISRERQKILIGDWTTKAA